MENENLTNQTTNQKKILLAQSEHAPIIIELMKDLVKPSALVGKSEYETVVNAITFDVQSSMIQGMVELLMNIQKGSLTQVKF